MALAEEGCVQNKLHIKFLNANKCKWTKMRTNQGPSYNGADIVIQNSLAREALGFVSSHGSI